MERYPWYVVISDFSIKHICKDWSSNGYCLDSIKFIKRIFPYLKKMKPLQIYLQILSESSYKIIRKCKTVHR